MTTMTLGIGRAASGGFGDVEQRSCHFHDRLRWVTTGYRRTCVDDYNDGRYYERYYGMD
jgi:hypothetical protein